MALHDIAQGISKELQGKSFAGSLKFDCGSDGVIILADGTASTTDRDTDCTIKTLSGQSGKTADRKVKPNDRCDDG